MKTNELILDRKTSEYKGRKDIPNGYVFATVNGNNEMHKLENVILISHGDITLGEYLNRLNSKNQALSDLLKLTSEKLIKIEKELKENGTIK